MSYVKTAPGFEVDFLARYPAAGQELIQVCADPSTAGTHERELRALEAAAADHPSATRRLLVLDRDGLAQVDRSRVPAAPVYEWLLENE